MNINVIGTFNMIKNFVKLTNFTKMNEDTLIINVSSVAAYES